MAALLHRIIEPKTQLEESRRLFSDADIKKLIVPLFFEQLLVMLVGIADTFMISYAGDAAVSGVSLVNMFNTIFVYLFSALASGDAVVVSQYIGSRDKEKAGRSASQLLMIITLLGLRVFGSGHHGALLQRETGGVLPLEVYLPLGK